MTDPDTTAWADRGKLNFVATQPFKVVFVVENGKVVDALFDLRDIEITEPADD